MDQKSMTLQKEKNANKGITQSKKTNVLYSLTKKEYQIYKKNQTKYKGITSSAYQTSQWNYF